MAKFFETITPEIKQFIEKQPMFFVGTAPTGEGEVNVSPKGYDTLRLIGDRCVLYLDYHGSGNETANHLRDNQKITFMWCSFEQEPEIIRVYGQGEVFEKGTDPFREILQNHFPAYDERIVRQIFSVKVTKVQSSCGWGVPFMDFVAHRTKLDDMSKKKFVDRQ